MLCFSDDGALNEEMMYRMLDKAYQDGARLICLTPHYHPGYYGKNHIKSREAYVLLTEYAEKKYPDLGLALGNELHYDKGCVSWLSEGDCRTLNGTKYVLIDFHQSESKKNIVDGIESLLRSGYVPILAHAERYDEVRSDLNFFLKYKNSGMLIQVNAGSLFNRFGRKAGKAAKKLIKLKLADFISSDAHGIDHRPPGMKKAFEYAQKKMGNDYADAICYSNAAELIFTQKYYHE